MASIDEVSYELGSKQAWTLMLQTCLKHLGYDSPESQKARWIVERENAIAKLRQLCKDFGDNDWPDDLHLGDIIEKHLADKLYEWYLVGYKK